MIIYKNGSLREKNQQKHPKTYKHWKQQTFKTQPNWMVLFSLGFLQILKLALNGIIDHG